MTDPYRVAQCDHGISFDEFEWRNRCAVARLMGGSMSDEEVRRRWPRLDGPCPKGCGYTGIYYASYLHYIAGDW